MIKFQILAVFTLVLQYGLAEPPVNTYLPSSKISTFSKNFAPPAANVSFNFGFSPRTSKTNGYKNSVMTMYDSKSLPISNTYEASFRNKEVSENNSPLASQHESKSNHPINLSSYTSYEAPKYHETSNNYDSLQSRRTPSAQYGAPAENVLPIVEDNLFLRKSQEHQINQKSHSAPVTEDNTSAKSSFGYGTSNSGHDGSSETQIPYDFLYNVVASESGVSLGHQEKHDGESAEGVYHNLLPDGRLLTVEYWADETGFKPKITYKLLQQSGNGESAPY